MTTVGLIGLGIMGSAMSHHLLAGGHAVVGYDVQPDRVAELSAAGGRAAPSAGEVGVRAEVVLTSLPTATAALDVCGQLAAAGRPGLLVVETSTLAHETKQACRRLLQDAGGELLDCPLSGTGAQARERDVVVLGSGDEAAFERVRPVLSAFSRSVRYLGPFGRGSAMKLIANLLVAVHNAATAEAFALGEAAGLDAQQIFDTIRDGAGNSVIFERRGRLMVDRAYQPATAKISMFVKDTALIADYAEQLDLATPLLDATRALYDRAVDRGLADADAAALLEVVGARSQPFPERSGMLTLARARRIASATLERGKVLGAAPLAVAVLDAGGHPVLLERAEGSGILRPQIAYAKAWGALGMGLSSREIGVRAQRQPLFFGALAAVADGRLAPAAGGVLLRGEDGGVLGAVGVSGDASDVDEVCALAGVAAVGLRSDPPTPGDSGAGG